MLNVLDAKLNGFMVWPDYPCEVEIRNTDEVRAYCTTRNKTTPKLQYILHIATSGSIATVHQAPFLDFF